MSGSPEVEIALARERERSARRQLIGLAALAAGGVVVAAWPGGGHIGVLVAVFATAGAVIEIGLIGAARGRAGRAVDELIGAGIVMAPGATQTLVDDRLRELSAPRTRRNIAATLNRALADAGRPRSSNPLVLAQRSIVLPRGTADALLAERNLVLLIAQTLRERPANPRAVLAIRALLYPSPSGAHSDGDQSRRAQRELHRIAGLLSLDPLDPPTTRL